MEVPQKVRLTIFLFLLLLSGTVSGQNAITDSLRQQLATAPADTNRVLLLSTLGRQLSAQNAVQALAYGQQGLQLARRLHYSMGEVYCLNAMAQAAFLHQDYVATARYYQQAVRLAEREPRGAQPLTMALLGLGRLAAQQEEFIEADKYFRLAVSRMRRRLHPVTPTDLLMGQNHLATLYLGWLLSGRPAPDSVARLHEQYTRQGLATYRRLSAAEKLALGDNFAFCLDNMATLHQRAKRYDSALYYHRQALRLFQGTDNKYGLAHTQQAMAEVQLAQHHWAEAAELLRPTIGWARQLHATGFEANGRQLLAEALDKTGQGHEAYQLAKNSQVLLDSLNSTEQRTALARLRVQFETERERTQVLSLTERNRLQRVEAQKQRQQFLWLAALLAAVAAGLAASGTLAWRLRRSRALLVSQNAELTATRAEQDRLYALVAHDLRNPVEAFTGLADLLTRYVERQDTARLAGLGGRVRQAAQGLRGLLDNLLSWALTQRGELMPKIERLAVAALLAEAAELYQPSAEAADLTLTVAPLPAGQPAPQVLADLNMTRTILRNLISNALRATPAGGAIILSAVVANGTVGICVRDTGEGMSEEQVQHLLTAVPRPTATGRPAGLGLRLSRAFTLAQNGQLILRSQPGQGTTAVLTLPMAPSAAPAMASAPVVWECPTTHLPVAGGAVRAMDGTGRAANAATRAIDNDGSTGGQ